MDSYIRAIRWASDRVGDSGVIGYVSGSGFVEKPAMDGLRRCLADEFSNIHVLNLRGDIRKNMLSKGGAKEGQNIFGSGSMTGIAITLFVKNPDAKQHGQIYYSDIGDDLSQTDKLEKISTFASIAGITETSSWQPITPDQHGDWIKQRDSSFSKHIVLGDKKGDALKLFDNYSLGVGTNRDVWCYNPSKQVVSNNMARMIDFYNSEMQRFSVAHAGLDKKAREAVVNGFLNNDSAKISWSSSLVPDLISEKRGIFNANKIVPSLYRPFTKQWLYYDDMFNHRVGQMPRIFPDGVIENRVICITGIGARSGFSALMADTLPDLHTLDTGQCFSLYLYDPVVPAQAGTQSMLDWGEAKPLDSRLRGNDGNGRGNDGDVRRDGGYVRGNDGYMRGNDGYVRRDAITDAGLAHFQSAYPGETISKEDVFYYVYGLLHSPDYRERYADNLSKELPRIPRVKTAAGFWAFSQAGRKLAELHLNYETVPIYQGAKVLGADGKVFNLGDPKPLDSRLRGNDDDGRGNDERGGFLARGKDESAENRWQKRSDPADLQCAHHHQRHPARSLRLHRERQARAGLGGGAPMREDRQRQRHR
jgi:predicted helicase